MVLTYKSNAPRVTATIGKLLAQEVVRTTRSRALIIALKGNLGSGKTTFVKGFVRGCGIRKTVLSPSFLIFKKYAMPKKTINRESSRQARTVGSDNVYHFDLYRLEKKNARRELKKLGWNEIAGGHNIILVEWAERAKKLFPKHHTLWITFKHGKKENERNIAISNNI